MQKMLVAVDGSENSDRALQRAKTLATAFGCEITILHVTEDLVHPSLFSVDNVTGNDVLLQKEIDRSSLALLEKYKEEFKDHLGKVNTLSRSGNPAKEIIEIAESQGYNLIIIGSRGLGAFPGAMLGSVSNKVVNKAKVDVLTVQ